MADARSDRLVSLDVLRGVAVMGMILVNSAAAIFYGAKIDVHPLLLHAHWDGITIADVVFPAFLLLTGISIPIASSRGNDARGLTAGAAASISKRALRLFVIGLILSNLAWLTHAAGHSWRLWGVLQRIGLVYAGCAMLFLATSSRTRLLLIVLILVLYWPLVLLPSLDHLPTDIWIRGHNFAASVDRVLLGAGGHNYVAGPAGYDPEGLVGTLPAIAHGLIGVAIGERLVRRRPGEARTLALIGGAMLVVGLAWSPFFPLIKDIWSSSFVLVTSGITILLLAACHTLFDHGGDASARWPVSVCLAFGGNAIAAYVLHEVTASVVVWDATMTPYRLAAGTIPVAVASLLPIAAYMALIWSAMAYLQRRKWVIKV